LVITASQRSTSWGSSCLDMALRDPNQSWHKSGTLRLDGPLISGFGIDPSDPCIWIGESLAVCRTCRERWRVSRCDSPAHSITSVLLVVAVVSVWVMGSLPRRR
jgi:hypothetical protein